MCTSRQADLGADLGVAWREAWPLGMNVQAMVAMVVTSDFWAMAWALGAVRLRALGWAPTDVATARAIVVAVESLLLSAAGAVFAASRAGA